MSDNHTVIALKLVSGEEVIARLIDNGSDFYRVSHPYTLSCDPTTGQVMMLEYFMSVNLDDAEISIPHNHVMMVLEPNATIVNGYEANIRTKNDRANAPQESDYIDYDDFDDEFESVYASKNESKRSMN